MIINSNTSDNNRYRKCCLNVLICDNFATAHMYITLFICVCFTTSPIKPILLKHFIQSKLFSYLLQVMFNGDLSSPFIVNSAAFPYFLDANLLADH